METTDGELLRRYVEERAETAFAEVVARHLHLVYFAALRQVGGDARRAEDVAQAVFTDLARKAGSLMKRDTLTGWLHTSTRFAAAKLWRADRSRRRYEQEAMTMQAITQDKAAAEWTRVRPVLDEAIHELGERDREAVLLRFFEGRAFAEIGAVLRVSEDAARMRVERALDKLRTTLARRGVDSTGAALAVAFANQAGAAVPAGLAANVAAGALASAGGGAATAGLAFFMGKTSTMVMGAVAVALVVTGVIFLPWYEARHGRAETGEDRADVGSAGSVANLDKRREGERAAMMNQPVGATAAARGGPTADAAEEKRREVAATLLKAQLRVLASVRDQSDQPLPAVKDMSFDRAYALGQMLHGMKGLDLSGISLVHGSPITVRTRDGVAVTYYTDGIEPEPGVPVPEGRHGPPYFTTPERITEYVAFYEEIEANRKAYEQRPKTPLEIEAEQDYQGLRQRVEVPATLAGRAYSAANDGRQWLTWQDLMPHFTTPEQAADYTALVESVQKRLDHERAQSRLVEARDSTQLPRAKEAYRAAHGGKEAQRWPELLPYFATTEEAADYAEFQHALRGTRQGIPQRGGGSGARSGGR